MALRATGSKQRILLFPLRHLIILAMDFNSLKINTLQIEESLLSRAIENFCSL